MDKRPHRSKPNPPSGAVSGIRSGDHPGGDGDEDQADSTLPVEEDDANVLGATRVIAPDNLSKATTSLKDEDTVLPSVRLPEPKQTQLLGDFRLLEKLGEGAMGIVYRAQQIKGFDRMVALKVLFPHVAKNPKLVDRLNREAYAMFGLTHPNIVASYGVYEAEGWHFIAMELVEGESLQKILGRLGRLSVGDALNIVLACARGLNYAHEQGKVHRDVKPDNILINRKGEVKITDLGMVKQDDDMSLTETGHAVGTPWYMPLEQARNAKDADGRCDIYALGCMLYCLLTGQPPFTGRTLVEVIQAKEKGTFTPARQFNPEVPQKLDLIIMKMASKNPRDRYQTSAEVVEALEGLELASPRLGFLFGEQEIASPREAAGLHQAPSTMEGTLPIPSAAAADAPAADLWYIRYTVAEKPVVRRMTTMQVINFIESTSFDASVSASRNPKEGFRSLATYREFQHLVLGRVSKSAADEKTVRYRSQYKKIEDQERKKQEELVKNREVTTFTYWLGNFVRIGGIGLIAGLVIFLLWCIATGRIF